MKNNIDILRCNPIQMDKPSLEYAVEIAERIMKTLIYHGPRDGTQEFQLAYMAGCLQFLEQYNQGKFFSIPHLIRLLNHNWKEVVAVSKTYNCPAMPYVPIEYNGEYCVDLAITVLITNIKKYFEAYEYWLLSGDDTKFPKIFGKSCPRIPKPSPWVKTPILELIKNIYRFRKIKFREIKLRRDLTTIESKKLVENFQKIDADISGIFKQKDHEQITTSET